MPPSAAQQSLFRAYDIRGANQYFTSSFIQALGDAFATLYNAQNSQPTQDINANATVETKQNVVVVGYDMRIGSEAIASTLSTVLAHHPVRSDYHADDGILGNAVSRSWHCRNSEPFC